MAECAAVLVTAGAGADVAFAGSKRQEDVSNAAIVDGAGSIKGAIGGQQGGFTGEDTSGGSDRIKLPPHNCDYGAACGCSSNDPRVG